MSDLAVRAVTAEDGPAATALIAACEATFADWLPVGWTPPTLAPAWPDGFVWARGAVEADGTLVAFVSIQLSQDRIGFGHVGAVFVHPSRWRQGIAAELLVLAEAEMRARGLAGAQLWTPAGSPAEHFYTAQGWARDGRREWHAWLGLTIVGYAKTLA